MRRATVIGLGILLLALLPVACESASYTMSGVNTHSHQNWQGGDLTVQIKKAHGISYSNIEVEDGTGLTLEADVTLTVERGSFKIELLGEGTDDQVTLVLEASDGETVSGHGQMIVDSFEEADYRITAVDAENVEYTIVYTFR